MQAVVAQAIEAVEKSQKAEMEKLKGMLEAKEKADALKEQQREKKEAEKEQAKKEKAKAKEQKKLAKETVAAKPQDKPEIKMAE